jgi:hypothetical protein
METLRSTAREAAEDLFFGQVVVNWARYFVIAAAIILMVWTADNEVQLVLGIVPVVAMLALNFFLHGRYLVERSANFTFTAIAGVLDLAVVTSIVVQWSVQHGLSSPMFVLYYPLLVAYAFVLPPRVSAVCAIAVLVVYTGTCLLVDSSFLQDVGLLKQLFARLITMGAMVGLGAYYWRVQRSRRRAAVAEAIGTGRASQVDRVAQIK